MNAQISPHERCGPYRAWSHAITVEIVRKIAAEDLGVESEGESLLEILQDVYAQGGNDAVSGLQAIAHTLGPDMTGAVLGVDWIAAKDKSADKDAPSTRAAGEPRTPD